MDAVKSLHFSNRTYTEEQLRSAVSSSSSYRQVLKKIGLKAAGGNYDTLKKTIKILNLDTTHMLGQSSNKGRIFGPKRQLSEYLVEGSTILSYKLKNRLLKDGIFNHICSSCDGTEWLGSSIPLELDHINGVNNDNRLENLRLLCPNCHALTPTYRGKNIGKNTD